VKPETERERQKNEVNLKVNDNVKPIKNKFL